MSELKLTDVELTGEYRQPRLAEWYLHDGVAKQGPSITPSYLVRPILRNGLWAMKQMLDGCECECTSGKFRWRRGLERWEKGSWVSWMKHNVLDGEIFWTRIDWHLVEPKNDTPVADSLREKMDWAVALIIYPRGRE